MAGSIEKTATGRYWARVRVKIDGKSVQLSKTKDTKKEAQLWIAQQLTTNHDSKENKYKKILLADYFEQWYTSYKFDKEFSTVHQYKSTLSVIKKLIPKMKLVDFDRTEFQKFINIYGSDHSKQTVAKRKNHLTQCLKNAYADGAIKKDPTILINLVGQKGRTADSKYLEADDFLKLEHFVENKLDKNAYLAIYIGIHTGARIGEIMALNYEDFNQETKELTINKAIDPNGSIKSTKTESSRRVIAVDDTLLNAVQGKSGRIITTSNNWINRTLKKIAKEINIKPITFHALRHSHGSFLISNGVSMNYVSQRLGHRDISITQKIYTHLLILEKKPQEQKTVSLFE